MRFGFASFDTSNITDYIQIRSNVSTMSIPLSEHTVEQAHKESNSLVDNIAAKYEQLDSGEFGTVCKPAFNAKSAKLASLFARMSQLCQRLNLAMSVQLHRLPFFKH